MIWSQTTSAIFSASNRPTGITLLSHVTNSPSKLFQQGDSCWYIVCWENSWTSLALCYENSIPSTLFNDYFKNLGNPKSRFRNLRKLSQSKLQNLCLMIKNNSLRQFGSTNWFCIIPGWIPNPFLPWYQNSYLFVIFWFDPRLIFAI